MVASWTQESGNWMHGGKLQEAQLQVHCALLSQVLPGGTISLNAHLTYPSLLDSQE